MKQVWAWFVGLFARLFAKRRQLVAVSREKDKTRRSASFDALAQSVIALRARCCACAGSAQLQTHHVVVGSALEFERSNILVLCMGANECHLRIGHGGDWRRRNPTVVFDAAESLRFPERRPAIHRRAAQAAIEEGP